MHRHSAFIVAVCAFLLPAAVALGHGAGKQVMGTLNAVEPARMIVETPDGHKVTVRLTTETVYRDARGAITRARPRVGDRVVIDVETAGEERSAATVRFVPKE